jgi:hypothetical protein
MFQIIQEASLPKLSQTSLYVKFNETSNISANIVDEIKNSGNTRVKPEDIPEIISLMRLNGDAIVKKAVKCYEKGEIIIINNKETSKVPPSLPFIIINQKGRIVAYVFADKIINNINSSQEYTSLMAVLEAAYLALRLYNKPEMFTMNRQLMLTLCNIYWLMVIAPLERKLYIKGDNLVKAMLYAISYFYKMIDGDNMSFESVRNASKRFVSNKIDDTVIKQIVDEVRVINPSFMNLIELIIKINPVRYKDLKATYLSYFTSTCGVPLIFALENLGYLFLLISSSNYKTPITDYGMNKTVYVPVKKAITIFSSMNLI